MKIEQYTMENGIKIIIKDMEEEYKYGMMEVNMKVIGKMIKLISMENYCMLMEIYMKENG
jgi:hypothetical protein